MFERLKFEFTDAWFNGPAIMIAYDEVQDKTYCYSSPDHAFILKDDTKFVLEGHDLVEELEKCNFRNWPCLDNPFVLDGYRWSLDYNDKNALEEGCNGSNAFPDSFYDFITVIKKYFPEVNFYEVSINKENYEIIDRKGNVLRTPTGWHTEEKTRKLLKNLTKYIDIFNGKTVFGKWSPEPNTSKKWSSENTIKYIKEVKQFKKDVQEIADKCKDLDLYNSFNVLDALSIEEPNEETVKNLLDNRSALLLIMNYMHDDSNNQSYHLEEALKNGNIVRILRFIQDFNHFKD